MGQAALRITLSLCPHSDIKCKAVRVTHTRRLINQVPDGIKILRQIWFDHELATFCAKRTSCDLICHCQCKAAGVKGEKKNDYLEILGL
jgi:hypothetical protein